jgi:signal transduction histidine kinase
VTAPDPTAENAALRQMVVRLSRLVEISVTVNATLDVQALLQFIVTTAADVLESEAATILLTDERTHRLVLAAVSGHDPATLGQTPVPLEGTIAGTIVREDRPLILNQVDGQPSLRQAWGRVVLEARSLAGVPMHVQDKTVGVLQVVNKRSGAFAEADARTLGIIASQAGVAIQNARLVYELRRANEELGKVDKLKKDFMAIASHELRTPLGVILGYAALLEAEAGGQASEHAAAVLNSAVHMRTLVESMTNLSLLEVAATELTLARHSLQAVGREAAQDLADLMRARGLALMERMPDESIEALVDAAKLRVAVGNLLDNALRFTPSGGHVWLEAERHGREAWLRVRDDGEGLEADQLERIFDQFYQVEEHRTRRHGGMGLGLAIVRAIASAHGGRAWAESSGPGRGAVFTIALPLRV